MIFRPASLIISVFIVFMACNGKSGETIPGRPANAVEVRKLIIGKKYTTQKTGFFGNLTINDKTEMEWIDAGTEREKYAKEAAIEQKKFQLQFLTDSTLTLYKKDTSFSASYKLDEEVGEYDEEQQGVKLRISYVDPEFKFGGEGSEITFTYVVLGAEGKKLLLQLPQSVNRRKLISLLSAE